LTKNKGLKARGLTTDAKLAVIENRYLDKKLALEDINIQSALYNIKLKEIDQWQQKYLLTSPSEGIVAFSNYWSVNQHVKSGDVVVNVVNASSTKMGKMELNQQGAGKVKTGQRVYIELAQDLTTTYGRKLAFSPNLLDSAKVITQDRRLLERFLDKIIYAFDQT
jgi:hypothetical protein